MLLREKVKRMDMSAIMVWDIVMIVDRSQTYNTWFSQDRRRRYTWTKPRQEGIR